MKPILIALILSLTSFNALSHDNASSKHLVLAYDDYDNQQNYRKPDKQLSRQEREDLEYEEDLEYARSKLEDKRIRGEIKGEVTDEMVLDYYHDWGRNY